MASPIGIFDTIAVSTDLFATWMRRQAEVTTLRHQPYADIFLDEVLWPQLLTEKDAILAALMEKCATAERPSDLSVPIWSFSHVMDFPKRQWEGEVDGPPHYYALERGDQTAQRVQQIHDNGWRPTLVLLTHDEDSTRILEKVTLYNVLKKTDFCHQLAARFGSNFVVSVCTEEVFYETDPSGQRYSRYNFSLRLNYFPWGLPEHHEKKRQAFVAKFAVRERRTLEAGEKLLFWKGESVIRYGPPLPPPCPPLSLGPSPAGAVPLLGDGWAAWAAQRAERSACHCCYAHDSDEESEE